MSFRKEKKVCLSAYEARHLKLYLINKGMTELFPPRHIQSIYFDNVGLDCFIHSEQGILPRKKIRIRWYGEEVQRSSLEIKISSVEGRYKTTKLLDLKEQENLFKSGIFDSDYGLCRATTKVSYKRAYYMLKNIRITFDSDIRYSRYSSQIVQSEKEEVVELKADINVPDDILESLLSIPFSRFSKYSRSVLKSMPYHPSK